MTPTESKIENLSARFAMFLDSSLQEIKKQDVALWVACLILFSLLKLTFRILWLPISLLAWAFRTLRT